MEHGERKKEIEGKRVGERAGRRDRGRESGREKESEKQTAITFPYRIGSKFRCICYNYKTFCLPNYPYLVEFED